MINVSRETYREVMCMYKKGDIILYKVKKSGEENVFKGKHLAIVVSNDKHNLSSNTLLVVPLSSKVHKANYKFNILMKRTEEGIEKPLNKDSICLIGQLQTISLNNVIKKISSIDTTSRFYKYLIRKICNFIND